MVVPCAEVVISRELSQWADVDAARSAMSQVDTRSLVADYVRHQLRKKALRWPGQPPSDDDGTAPSKVEQTMRVLGEEFEHRYTQVGNEVAMDINSKCLRISHYSH